MTIIEEQNSIAFLEFCPSGYTSVRPGLLDIPSELNCETLSGTYNYHLYILSINIFKLKTALTPY